MSNYPPRLAESDIKYLALEGGGGKGNVFIGALQALAHLNVIQHAGYKLSNILGVSGASAGAITSLFLAMGYSPDELKLITEVDDFNAFFDESEPGRVFRIGGFQTVAPPSGPRNAALVDLLQEYFGLRRDVDLQRLLRRIAARSHVDDMQESLRAIEDELSRLPASDSFAAAGAIMDAVTARMSGLMELGRSGVMNSLQAIREFLDVLPGSVWARISRIARLIRRLLTLEVEAGVLWNLYSQLDLLLNLLRVGIPDAAYTALLARNGETAITALAQDFGFMKGEAIYNFFRRWLAVARWRVANPSLFDSYVRSHGTLEEGFRSLRQSLMDGSAEPALVRLRDDNMNFRDFETEFGVKLVLVGSNLETLKSHVFSARTTPNFYVVDAVRLSMSLPFGIFKPLVIRANDDGLTDVIGPGEHLREADPVSGEMERHPLIGVWVDGGIYNNIPSRVFDREPSGQTLSLRLDSDSQERPAEVNTLARYFVQHPGGTFVSSGETQTSHSFGDWYQSIALNTAGLNLLSFGPPPAVAEELRQKAIRYVLRYFNREYQGGL